MFLSDCSEPFILGVNTDNTDGLEFGTPSRGMFLQRGIKLMI
jgi:hypothetical protein